MKRTVVLTAVAALAVASAARAQSSQTTQPTPPLAFAQPEGQAGPPAVITLQDALERAATNDAQFLSVTADMNLAREDRVQAKASLLPSIGFTTQYLATQGGTPLTSGRFVSNDGVSLYRSWLMAHQELSADLLKLTPYKRAQAAEALADARLEVARRGLTVTVTQRYYELVTAERRYATAQLATTQAQRFLDNAQKEERLGQVARADVVKADIQHQLQQQGYREASLQMQTARLMLAVLLFPDLNENFTVVDDLGTTPPIPPFAEARSMAGKANPDLRAASEALKMAALDVAGARNAFFPTVVVDADYGIEANKFALHSVALSAPELGVVPNLGYFVTVNLSMPLWDWGGLRSKLQQSHTRQTQAQAELTQTQRQLLANLYALYNDAVAARSAAGSAQQIAELAAESLRLTNLRYQAGESTVFEVVDAQNTLVGARNGYDAQLMRYRVAVAQLQTLTGAF